jgi:hypothetical protein
MFEKVVLRRSEDGDLPTLGDVAEALLFYQRVHLVLDRASVFNFSKAIGIDGLLKLLRRDGVSAVYCRDQLATKTQQIGAMHHHDFITLELAGKERDGEKKYTARDALEQTIRDATGYSSRQARKAGDKFLELVPMRALAGGDFLGPRRIGLADAAKADVFDIPYLTEAMSCALSLTPGFSGFVTALSLDVQPTSEGFAVFSNLDLRSINERRSKETPSVGPLTIGHLLTEIISARSDMLLAAHYGSDYKTSRIGSALISLKHEEMIRRSKIHAEERNQFQQVVVNEGRSLKEVIDSGGKSFEDFLELLDKAGKFKNWTGGIHPDTSMIKAYFEEKSREGWIGSLPAKTFRFVIGGMLDGGASTAFGLADSFLLEKLTKGWRPNHFVDGRLKPFVND